MPELKRILFEEPGQRKLVARPFIMPEKPYRKCRTLKPRVNISLAGEQSYIIPLEETEAIPLGRMIEMILVKSVTEKQNPFGAVLSRFRRQYGLTQERLEKLVGIPNSLISQYETGFRFPSVARVMQLGQVLKKGEEAIYSGWVEEYNRRASQPIVSDSEVQMSCVEPSVLEQVIDESVNPFENAAGQLLKKDMDDVLRTLTQRERRVLQLLFGFDDGRQCFLEETGEIFGVSPERIRQIKARALRKLRHPSRAKKLRDYFDC